MANIYLKEIDIKDRVVPKERIIRSFGHYYSALQAARLFKKSKQTIHQAILKGIFDTAVCYEVEKYHSWFIEKVEIDTISTKIEEMPEAKKSGQKFTSLLYSAKE